MIISIQQETFEECLQHKSREIRYKITYPHLTYPIKSEAEGRINSELFGIALSVRSFARSLAAENADNEKYRHIDISFEMICSYNEGLFLSFPAETVICLDKDKTETFYFTRNYKTSSAKPVTFDMLTKPQTTLSALYERIYSIHPDIMEKISQEEFLNNFKTNNFYLTPTETVIFFPPKSILKEKNEYIRIFLPYKSIKDILKYRLE